jgi:predicted DNA-binding transcriptional regulator AlpA
MKKYLTAAEVEQLFGISQKTLANWRSQGRGPQYLKIGHGVRYAAEDLEKWAESRRVLTIGLAFISEASNY